jgi:ABC-type dipeptide/oligopeptide/nickel transport system permease component
MWKRIAVRVALVPVIFVVVSAGTFWLLYGPLDGSPADDLVFRCDAGRCPPELIEQAKRERGWDDPLYEQYGRWLGNAVRGDLGTSVVNYRPVAETLRERFEPTLELISLSIVVALGAGWGLATLFARAGRGNRRVLALTAALMSFPPVFVLSMMLMVPFEGWDYSPPLLRYDRVFDDPAVNLRMFLPPAVLLGLLCSPLAALVFQRSRRPTAATAVLAVVIISPVLTLGSVAAEEISVIPGIGMFLWRATWLEDYVAIQALASIAMTIGIAFAMFATLVLPAEPHVAAVRTSRDKVLWKDPMLVAAALLVLVFAIVAAGGLLLRDASTGVYSAISNQPSSIAHPLGTDRAGRDVLAQVFISTRYAFLLVGLTALAGVPAAVIGWVLSRRIPDVARYAPSLVLFGGLPIIVLYSVLATSVDGGAWILVAAASPAIVALGIRAGALAALDSRGTMRAGALLPPLIEAIAWSGALVILLQATVGSAGLGRRIISFGGLLQETRGTFPYDWTNSLFIGGWLTLLLFGFLLIAVRLAAWRQDAEAAAAAESGAPTGPYPLTADG